MTRTLKTHLRGPGLFGIDVVGESHYQENLNSICAPPKRLESKNIQAKLVSEDDNPHDVNAIRVEIKGLKVGYLDRKLASKIRSQLQRKGFTGIEATCAARIVSGRSRSSLVRRLTVSADKINLQQDSDYAVKLDIFTAGDKRAARISRESPTDFTFSTTPPSRVPNLDIQLLDQPIKFWSPEDDPQKVFAFVQGGVGGSGNAGRVPAEFVRAIRPHMDRDLAIEAKIISVESDGSCRIQCHLLKPEEAEAELKGRDQQREERRRKLAVKLAKPYRPRGPIEFQLSAPKGALKKGSKLEVKTIPTADEYLARPDESKFVFHSPKTGDDYEITRPPSVMERLIRINLWCDEFDVRVTKARGTRYQCELSPQKTIVSNRVAGE